MNAGEPPLVGRDEELALISGALDALGEDTSSRMLQVAGEPGIGKSRLLAELCDGARARGYLVLAGRAAEFEAELPFGVFADAIDDWLMGLDPERLERLADDQATALAVVFPAFERLASGRHPELQQERYRAYRAVRGLLSALAAESPVVLALDDIQWADPGSVELIGHLIAHPPRGAVLGALGFRPAQITRQLSIPLAAALREGWATRLDLAPLSAAAARELIGGRVSGAQHELLYSQSGGNPFFLLQLTRGVQIADRLPAIAGLASSVPETVRAALASELSSLSAPSLVLLQGAAVTGDPFEALLAAGAAAVGNADALDLIDELLAFALVHPADAGGHYAFRHPIVRATVYELAAPSWRARAHARVAALLAERGASSSARAPHVERSAAAGDADAVRLLVAAGASNAARAPALAARWYAAALRLLPDTDVTSGQRVELLIALATALAGAGQLEQSRGALCEVLARLPAGHPARVSVTAFCAGVEHLLGRHRDAAARLGEALRVVEDQASAEAVSLMVELAAGSGYENRYDDMMRWAGQALEGATALGERALTVAAAGQIALGSYFLGLPTAGEATDRAAAGMDALTDEELATRLDIGLWVGWTEAVMERSEQAIGHCQRVIDVCRATGQGAVLMVTFTAQVWSLLRMGRLDEAEDTIKGAIEAGRLAPHLFLSIAVGQLCLVSTYKGDYDRAARAGEECVRLARSADPGLIPGMAGLYQAFPLIEIGEAQRARDIVLAMSGSGDELQTSRSGYTSGYELLTRAEIALGRLDAAEAWARKGAAAAPAGELAGESAFAQRALAAVALARGDAPHAARLTLDAAAHADRCGIPVEAGRCRILAARALVAGGQRSQAIAQLDLAVDGLARIAADGYRAEAERELRRLGRRVARRPRASAGAGALRTLTERERQIAELVHQGLTNREIAATVYVSEKTVERHLSRVFAKLGVSGRTALALLVAAQADPAA